MSWTLSTVEVKAHLSELIERVRARGDRLIVLRRGRPVAAVVGVDDLRRLEQLDAEVARGGTGARHPVMRAYGAWEPSVELDGLVETIYAERAASVLREVEF